MGFSPDAMYNCRNNKFQFKKSSNLWSWCQFSTKSFLTGKGNQRLEKIKLLKNAAEYKFNKFWFQFLTLKKHPVTIFNVEIWPRVNILRYTWTKQLLLWPSLNQYFNFHSKHANCIKYLEDSFTCKTVKPCRQHTSRETIYGRKELRKICMKLNTLFCITVKFANYDLCIVALRENAWHDSVVDDTLIQYLLNCISTSL